VEVPVERIEPNPWNPRAIAQDEAMKELLESIRKFGVLQPICVRPHPTKKEKYEIVYGHRRWLACKTLGIKTIPVNEPIRPLSDKEVIDMMGDENIRRQAYSPVELAKYFELRNKIFGETQESIAQRFGVEKSSVSRVQQLVRLPEEIKPKVSWGIGAPGGAKLANMGSSSVTVEHARQILRVPDKQAQIQLAEEIEKNNFTVIQTKRLVDETLGIEPSHSVEWTRLNCEVTNNLGNSRIRWFNKTPSDIVCPHFWELIWATGCPYSCAWCYLQGTFYGNVKPKFYDKPELKEQIVDFFDEMENLTDRSFVLNTGELADSLMGESQPEPFSRFVIELFEKQRKHKVLFLTKSTNIENLLRINSHRQVIVSFSINADPVAKKWEKGAPTVADRIEAARKVSDAGYETRIRIDPMVPVPDWQAQYQILLEKIFDAFVPQCITLGTLRGLAKTIRFCKDSSWAAYLSEESGWGKKIGSDLRYSMYSNVINYLKEEKNYAKVAICKETKDMWQKLGMNWSNCHCNCVY